MDFEQRHSGRIFAEGIALCLLGAICFSTKAIFVKLAYRDTSVDSVSLLALRMLLALPFFLVSAAVSSSRQANVRFTQKQWLLIAFIGCMGYYISSLLDFIGLRYISASIERLILFIYPTLVLLISMLVYKRRAETAQWLALVITYTGLALAFAGEVGMDTSNKSFVTGSLFVFACALTYAVYIVGSGQLIPHVGAAKFNSYALSFACIAVLIHFFISSDNSLLAFEPAVYSYGAMMAIISTVVPTYLISAGIRRIGSNNAAIVGSVGPVSTIVLAWYFLGETFSLLQFVGTLLILCGVWIISTSQGRAVSGK